MERDELPGRPLRGVSAGWSPGRDGWPIAAPPGRDLAATSVAPFGGELSRAAFAAFFGLGLALAMLPLAFVTLPPLTDYPFHLARISILEHWQQWPSLHAFYELRSFVLPNIATDLLMLGAIKIVPLEIAGRLFVALTMAVMLSGTVALHWSLHRRFAIWPLVAALFLHNWIMVFGFLNYLFGIGLMLWGLAIWIALAERPAWQRLAVGAVIAPLIFFAHLMSFGIYALMIAGYELQRAFAGWRDWRTALGRLIVGGLPFVPPLALFWLLSPTSRDAGDHIKYAVEWYWKGFVVARTFMSMNLGLDMLTAATLLLVALAVLWRGRILFAREMLVGSALVLMAFLVMPWRLFGGVFVDARMPVALLFIVIACAQINFTRAWTGRAVYGLLGALLIARAVVIAGDWSAFDRTYAQLRQALAQVPPDSVILSATAAAPAHSLPEWIDRWRPPITHAPSLALLDKPVFAVSTWATPSQQPIAVTPEWVELYRYQEQNPMLVESTQELTTYLDRTRALIERAAGPTQPTYLLLLYPDYVHYPLPRRLVRLAAGPRFILFRVAG